MDKFNLDIKDIIKAKDNAQKMLRRIEETDNERKQDEIKQTKKTIEEVKVSLKYVNSNSEQLEDDPGKSIKQVYEDERYFKEIKSNDRFIIVGGNDQFNQLIANSNSERDNVFINPPLKSPLDPSSLLSYSSYYFHTVLVTTDGKLLGAGYNSDGRISDTLPKTIITEFTEFSIKDSNNRQLIPVSAVCCNYGTLYMFMKSNGDGKQLVYCSSEINRGKPVFLNIGNEEPVSLFGGASDTAVITAKGEVIFINHNSVKMNHDAVIMAASLPNGEKVKSIAFFESSFMVLSSNGHVFWPEFQSWNRSYNFSEVNELAGYEIVSLSGSHLHILAVTKEGRVFGRGSNFFCQLGFSKQKEYYSFFTEISSLGEYKIKAAYAGHLHTLLMTSEGKILGIGCNGCGQFLSNKKGEMVYIPSETIIEKGATFCIAGGCVSIAFIGNPPPFTPNTGFLVYT